MAGFLRNGFIVLAAVLFSIEVAFASRTIVVPPADIKPTYTPGSDPFAFNDSRNWTEPVSTQGGARVGVPVQTKASFKWPKWASAAKAAIKGNAAQAVAAAGIGTILAGVDWLMKEGTLSKPTLQQTNSLNLWQGYLQRQWTLNAGSAPKACEALVSYCSSLYSVTRITGVARLISTGTYSFQCTFKSENYNSTTKTWSAGPDQTTCMGNQANVYTNNIVCPSGATYDASTGECKSKVYSPVSDLDIDSLVNGVNDPNIAADSAPFINQNVPGSFDYPDDYTFSGPETIDGPATTTTTTNPTTGDTTTSTSQPTYNFDFSTNPLTITTTTTTTTNNYTNGQLTSTTTATTQPDPSNVNTGGGGAVANIEVPTDCDFMPTVCRFIEWVKTPFTEQAPDFSEFAEDKDFAKSVTVSGNATCPAPTIISTSRGDFEFSWEPACQWAAMIKPLVIIAALLGAIYINLGIGRSD